MGVHVGHCVCHGGDGGDSLDLNRLGSLDSNWGGGIDIGDVVGNGGNGSPHGSNGSNTNVRSSNQVGNSVSNGGSHDSLADGILDIKQ